MLPEVLCPCNPLNSDTECKRRMFSAPHPRLPLSIETDLKAQTYQAQGQKLTKAGKR